MQLIDCFMPVIAYLVGFQSALAQGQPDFEPVKGEIRRLLLQSEKLCRLAGLDSDDFDQARFMVCAWIDETVLASQWCHKRSWQHEQLQRIFYGTTDAGVEAFERLSALEPHRREVREVYCTCLALGFKGRFVNPGDQFQLEQLKQATLKALPGASNLLEEVMLFPEAMATDSDPGRSKGAASSGRKTVTPLVLAVPVLLFVLLYFIYHFSLSSITDRAFQ